jgi:hypothetical protein
LLSALDVSLLDEIVAAASPRRLNMTFSKRNVMGYAPFRAHGWLAPRKWNMPFIGAGHHAGAAGIATQAVSRRKNLARSA